MNALQKATAHAYLMAAATPDLSHCCSGVITETDYRKQMSSFGHFQFISSSGVKTAPVMQFIIFLMQV